MNKKLICMTDIETTGLSSSRHEIIDIGAVLFDADTHEIVDTFMMRVRPERPEDGDPKAYACNGYTPEKWEASIPFSQAIRDYADFAGASTLCAYNVSFDWSFLEAAQRKAGIMFGMDYHRLDLMSMAVAKLGLGPKSKKLKDVCEYLGIVPESEIHEAINGAMCAYQVYCKLNPKV